MNQQFSSLYHSTSSALPNKSAEEPASSKLKMKRLADRMQNQSEGFQEKKQRWQEIEDKIRQLEESMKQEGGQEEQREHRVAHDLALLEQDMETLRAQLKNMDIQAEEQLIKMNNDLGTELKGLRAEQKGVDEEIIRGLDEKYKENILLVEENQAEYQNALGESQDGLVEQVHQLESALAQEAQQRHQAYQQMNSTIQGHLQTLMNKVTMQIRLNDDTHSKVMAMIASSTAQLQQELKAEKEDRQHTVDTMLSLLENAVQKIDHRQG